MTDSTDRDRLLPDPFDRTLAEFDGLPNSLKTDERVIRVMPHFGIGGSTTFLLTTIRKPDAKERMQDWIFLEVVRGGDPVTRLVLPPEVTSAIHAQHDRLTARNRRIGARQAAATRKARGIEPAFLRPRGRRRSKE